QSHSEIDQIDHDLRVSLRLHLTAHHAEADPRLTIFGDESRDDGMKRTFRWRVSIELAFLQIKERPAILQGKAESGRDHARAEPEVDTLDQGNHGALPVGHGEINGVSLTEQRLAKIVAVGCALP